MSTFLLKKQFHTELCQKFIDDIQFGRANYFYFLGRVAKWNSVDETPLLITENQASENNIRSEMVTYKKVSSGDVSFVIPRIDWVSGTVYSHYDSTQDQSGTNFYCMTSDFNVYKCLDNSLGSPSTSRPTGNSFNPVLTGDGYLWKYMYTVPPIKRAKFLSSTKLPVQRALTDRFYNNGAIYDAVVLTSGSGYTQETTSITVIGDGSGAVLSPVISGGQLVDVIITDPGIGYSYAELTVEGPHGTLATLQEILSDSDLITDQSTIEQTTVDGAIYHIKAVTPGTNYTSGTTVTVSGDGTGCTATPFIVNGQIVAYTITNPGSGYSYATVSIQATNLSVDPNSSAATAIPMIPPLGGHGSDAISELYADSVCVFSNIRYSDQISAINQDFREYGLIKNIRKSDGNLVTQDQGIFAYSVNLTNAINLVKDEILFSVSGSYFRVIEIGSGSAILSALSKEELSTGMVLTSLNSQERTHTIGVVTQPGANKYTGQMLFVSDSDAFTFTDEQEITIKTFIKL